MFLSLACPRLISQLYLIFVPFCSARFLLSRAWKESEDCISPTLPDLAKQLRSIALRDHAPSSLQASLLKTTRQATPKFSLFESARQAQSSPTRRPPSVVQSHYCVRNIWATYGPHMGSPSAAHMQPICGPYVECFQKQPNCMWPICCLTYGNIWLKTNQHMG